MSISHVIDHHCDGQTQVASDSWLIGYGSKQLNKELWKFFKSSSSRRQKWLDFLHQPLTSAALPSFQSRIHLPLVPRSQLQCIRLATKCTRSHNLSFTRDRTFFPKRIAPKIPTAGVIDKAQSSEFGQRDLSQPCGAIWLESCAEIPSGKRKTGHPILPRHVLYSFVVQRLIPCPFSPSSDSQTTGDRKYSNQLSTGQWNPPHAYHWMFGDSDRPKTALVVSNSKKTLPHRLDVRHVTMGWHLPRFQACSMQLLYLPMFFFILWWLHTVFPGVINENKSANSFHLLRSLVPLFSFMNWLYLIVSLIFE